MEAKVKKPYKRNITELIADFEDAVFNKKMYINEPHQKLSKEEKKLLGVFDVSFNNLEETKKLVT